MILKVNNGNRETANGEVRPKMFAGITLFRFNGYYLSLSALGGEAPRGMICCKTMK